MKWARFLLLLFFIPSLVCGSYYLAEYNKDMNGISAECGTAQVNLAPLEVVQIPCISDWMLAELKEKYKQLKTILKYCFTK